ncbi:MAG: SMC-Scp complex subunit ScpB [Nitrososphaerota archaeon]
MSTADDPKLLAEAMLFASDRPLGVREIQKALKSRSTNKVLGLLEELKRDYSGRAIEVVELEGGRYFMRLRPELNKAVKRFARRQVLTPGVLKTLATIAYHQPVSRANIVAVRGKDAYRQIKTLMDRGLVTAEKSGRNQMLRTTQLFADLFGVENTPQAIRAMMKNLLQEGG